MAYNPIVGDLVECRIVCTASAPVPQVSENVVHYSVQSVTGGGATQAQIALTIDALVNGSYKAIMSNQAVYRGVSIQRCQPLPRVAFEFSIANAGGGFSAFPLLPCQSAAIGKWTTALAGRPFRGRLYFPFASTNELGASGAPSATMTGNVALIMAALLGPITSGSSGNQTVLLPVIWHRRGYGGQPNAKPVPIPPTHVGGIDLILTGAAEGAWATQRRRGMFGRPNAISPF
jgi:hypothetical protein